MQPGAYRCVPSWWAGKCVRADNHCLVCDGQANDQWYEMQDLHVQETMPQLIGLSESYIMVYRAQKL